MIHTLRHPTVSELINYLKTCDQQAKVTIEDADTNWTIETIHVSVLPSEIQLYGDYSEMNRDQ